MLSTAFVVFSINFLANSISNLQSESSVFKYQQFAKSLISISFILLRVKLCTIKTGFVLLKKSSPYRVLKFSISFSETSQYTKRVFGVCAKSLTTVFPYLYGKS